MIVTCDQCQTKFRIPDEKVTDKGVKVRCTKCGNTFRVTKEASGAAAAPAPPAADPSTRAARAPVKLSAAAPTPLAPSPTSGFPFDDGPSAFEPPTRVSAPPVSTLQSMARSSAPIEEVPTPALGAPQLGALAAASRAPEPSREDLFGSMGDAEDWSSPPAPDASVPRVEDLGAAPPPPEPSWGEPDDFNSTLAMPPPPPEPIAHPLAAGFSVPALGPLVEAGAKTPTPRPAAAAPPAAAATVGRVRRWVGNALFFGVLFPLAALLGISGLMGGKLDKEALSGERLKAIFSGPRALLPTDVTNGLYETKAGRAIFYVRGQVENRGKGPTPVRVRVEILDGEQLVRSGVALAGVSASPEELHNLSGADDVEALRKRLDDAADAVEPGEKKPFLVLFYEYPADLPDYRLRVVAEAAADPATAKR